MSHCRNGGGTIMKKAVCIRERAPGQIKGGEFSRGARSGQLSGCKIFKLHDAQIQILNKIGHSSSTRHVYTKKRITKSYFWAFYLSACLSFSSLCPVCMCGCGGDNGGGVSLPRPLLLVPPTLKLFLSLNIFTSWQFQYIWGHL